MADKHWQKQEMEIDQIKQHILDKSHELNSNLRAVRNENYQQIQSAEILRYPIRRDHGLPPAVLTAVKDGLGGILALN